MKELFGRYEKGRTSIGDRRVMYWDSLTRRSNVGWTSLDGTSRIPRGGATTAPSTSSTFGRQCVMAHCGYRGVERERHDGTSLRGIERREGGVRVVMNNGGCRWRNRGVVCWDSLTRRSNVGWTSLDGTSRIPRGGATTAPSTSSTFGRQCVMAHCGYRGVLEGA